MKKRVLFSLSAILLFSLKVAVAQTWVEKMQDPNVNFYDVQKSFNKYYKNKEKEFRKEEARELEEAAKKMAKLNKSTVPLKGSSPSLSVEKEEKELAGGWEIYKRWEDYMTPRLYPTGDRSVMANAMNEYLDNFYAESAGGTRAMGPSTPTTMAANWSLIGPTTTIPSGGGGAGRLNFVRFDPTASTTIYVGSPGGGLWKSTNSGVTWTTGTDNLALIGTSDIAINPTNTAIQYLATGDGEAQDTYSLGVLKTTNGGTTWLPTGLSWTVTNFRTISKLLMNPQNPNTLFAATSNGVYRTRNAGAAWTQIATAVANIKDMEFKPGDTTTVYACSTTQFYLSTNGGTSFVTTSTGLPAAASCSRLAIGVTAANAAYVYVLAANTAYGYQGLYRSTNSGVAFSSRSTTPNILGYSSAGTDVGGQGWYDLSIAVSPVAADEVIVGGVNIWRSTNGGTSWTLNAHWTGSGAPYVHADVHALEFLPGSGTTYFAGCDGGCFRTTNSGAAWSDLSNGLQISQAYRIGVSATNANLLNTGWQDNGTARWNGGTSWSRPLGGDGMECIVDWSNANVQYGELYYGDINKTTTGGNYTTNIVASGGTGVNADGAWVTPYIQAPSNAATLFVGKAQVYKSTNSGTTWAQVGTISGGTGNVIALANAASNINYIYAAKIDKMYVSTTGTAFVDRTAGLPTASAAISYIAVDPLNASRVWVTFSGYSAANKVWYSADAGVTWSNYSTGLPNLPANCIVYQGSSVNDPLYVGTDVGVYYRDNTAGSWTAYNTGLPNVAVRELEIQYTASKLRAATFGRSIWQSDLASPGTSPPVADFVANRTNICVGDCISFTDLSTGSPTSWAWTFTGGTPSTSTLQNPASICYNAAGTYTVTLIATNSNGSNTMTKTAYITVSAPIALPLVEGFQATFIPPGWQLINPDADFAWTQSTAAGGFGTSTQCASFDNYSPAASTAGLIDEMVTPKYNFTGVSSATMTFDVAYARYGLGSGGAMFADSLIAYVSTNCGATWTPIYAKGGYSGLATAPDNNAAAFVPTAAQWRTETVNMTPYAGMANVSVKFQNRSGWGQMLYLDNINITGAGAVVASVAIVSNDADNTICAGTSVTFTATPTNGGTTPTYQWQINGVNVGGATASTFTTTTLTTGQIVTCIMTSSLGGVVGSPATSNSITMTVNALPTTPTATNTGPYCVGGTITLATPTVAGATYSWTGPSAFTSTLQNPTRPSATVAMAGTYSVTVTNAAGCTSLAGTTTVVVNALPATPTATNTGPYCAGATITLNTPTIAGATYAWTGPGGFTSALQNPTRPTSTVAMAGTYSVTVTVGGCASLAGTTTVVVNAAPATPTVGSSTPDCVGQTISLTANTIAGATYSWTGPASYTSALEDPTIASATLAMAGTYSLTVTVGGCTSAIATTTVVVNALPATPTATNTGPYCAGTTISLSTPTVSGATYAWTGPATFTSAIRNPTRPASTVAMAGTYSVTITTGGCTSLPGTTTVVVNPIPAAPTAGSNSPVCTGSTILLTSNTIAGATYAWTGPSTFTSTLEDPSRPTATLVMAGTYSVTATVAGCTSPVATTVVAVSGSVVPTNAITASPSGAICAGTPVTFTATAGGGGTTPTYQWQVNGTSVGTGGTTYTSSSLINGDIVTCILSSSSSCATPTTATSNAITMTVNPVVVPSVTVAESPTGAICAGTSVTFTASPTNGGTTPTYQWQVNGANVGTGGTTYTSASLANSDVVTCIMTSNATCLSTATATSTGITMTVNPTVVPTISIAIGSGTNPTCSGLPVMFVATITNGGASPTYQWQINGSNAGTGLATFMSSTLINGDVITCILTSNAACASPATATSAGITMTVDPTPATPTISVSGSVLTSSSPTGNQWYLNGVIILGATSQNYTFTANGTYTVVVTNGPCASAASAPTVITTTGITDNSNAYLLSISPNPNDGNFTISFNVAVTGNYKMELTNALGQLIYKEELKDYSGTYKKDMSVVEYGKGVYTITLTNDKNEVVKKIMVY